MASAQSGLYTCVVDNGIVYRKSAKVFVIGKLHLIFSLIFCLLLSKTVPAEFIWICLFGLIKPL